MNTSRRSSTSTITGLSQRDESVCRPQNDTERPRQTSNHRSPPLMNNEQLHPYPTPLPPPGYYPFYPPPLSSTPPMSYFYIDFMRQMALESDLRGYIPKVKGVSTENNSEESHRKTSNVKSKHAMQNNECDHPHCKDGTYNAYSTLCLSCEQRLRCACCSKPLIPERPILAANKPYNCCPCLLPPHSHMHVQHSPVISCNCACQIREQIITKQKLKKKSNKKNCNQTCLQSNRDNIPERDNTSPQMTNKTSKKAYSVNDTSDSSSSDASLSQSENRIEGYESECRSEEDETFAVYKGEGDKHKSKSTTKRSEVKKKEKKTRKSLAYFINV